MQIFGTRALEEDFFLLDVGVVIQQHKAQLASTMLHDLMVQNWLSGFNFDINGNAEVYCPSTQDINENVSLWAVRRETRSDSGNQCPTSTKICWDAPFYSRSAVKNDVEWRKPLSAYMRHLI